MLGFDDDSILIGRPQQSVIGLLFQLMETDSFVLAEAIKLLLTQCNH